MFEPENDQERVLQWRCRRGLKELDIMIQPFLNEHYRSLSAPEQAAFARLMQAEDMDLLDWFLRHAKPADAELERAVETFLERLER